ncbi:MAG: membrane protein insertion efficiency factor YidD [Alphaproteobacteria bacterium]|nr:membrane protein insertion efficiency factor YidD [Alphaproteobacteria bacterium]
MKYIFLTIIGLYRYTLAYFLGGRCRFTPSCSAYAAAAITKHGAWRGGWLTMKRLVRCHPYQLPVKFLSGGSGHDPVP